MTTTLRIDDTLKSECEAVLDDLGLSMTGAITLFLKQVVKQRAIPFFIACDRQQPVNSFTYRTSSLRERGRTASRFAAEMRESNNRDWSTEEIDAEIAESRRSRNRVR